jgi:hypothetical protein
VRRERAAHEQIDEGLLYGRCGRSSGLLESSGGAREFAAILGAKDADEVHDATHNEHKRTNAHEHSSRLFSPKPPSLRGAKIP